MMAIQDRTSEFRAAVSSQLRIKGSGTRGQRSLPGSTSSAGGTGGGASGSGSSSANVTFMVRASSVAKDIADTMAMLQRLAQLAKRKTMFDDRPQEIDELTVVVKQKTSSLTESIKALKPLAASVENGSSWSASKREREQLSQHSRRVLMSLEEKVKDITGDFTDVLTARSKSLQASRNRTDQFLAPNYAGPSGGVPGTPVSAQGSATNPLYRPPSRSTPHGSRPSTPGVSQQHSQQYPQQQQQQLQQQQQQKQPNGYSENPYASENPFAMAGQDLAAGARDDVFMLPEQEQSQVLLQDQQSSYLSSRSSAVEAIESTINELGSMFSQLSTMVAEQRETVQRIDANTEDISLSVGGAQREILKYYARVSSNRWLMIKSFGVILFFFLIWVLIS